MENKEQVIEKVIKCIESYGKDVSYTERTTAVVENVKREIIKKINEEVKNGKI